MPSSLRALLSGVIDYAGLFPPAKLPLEMSLRNYARYRGEAEAWMLGRFVIPAARLKELDAFANVLDHGSPIVFSVLGRGGDSPEAWTAGLHADIEAVKLFRSRHPGHVVDAFEVKAPPDALAPIDAFALPTKALGTAGMSVVYEVPLDATLPEIAARLAGSGAGVKFRTGGLEASAFPSVHQLARAIATCRMHRLPLKCTAGLHHPLRHYNDGVKADMHGFLNVILAAVFAYTHGLIEQDLAPLLACTTLEDITFSNEGVSCLGQVIDTDTLAAARQDAFLSFGSCSFDEPRDDLRALGLM